MNQKILTKIQSTVQKIIWIGGWASPMVCWHSFFQEKYPNCQHVYYDVADLIQDRHCVKEFENIIDSSKIEGEILLVGWSTGSLWVHHWLKSQDASRWNGTYICSISPIFSFCSSSSTGVSKKVGWSPSVLNRMIQFLKKSLKTRNYVLQDFWKSMERGSVIPKNIKDLWWEQAQTLTEKKLVISLEFLRETVVDLKDLKDWKCYWTLYIDKKDPIAIWDPQYEKLLSSFNHIFHHQGHIPFFVS